MKGDGTCECKERLKRMDKEMTFRLLGRGSSKLAKRVSIQESNESISHRSLYFARGIRQRQIIRMNTLPSITRRTAGLFASISLREENARIILLAIFLLIYLLLGALLFQALEHDNELKEKANYQELLFRFRWRYCSKFYLNCHELDRLLDLKARLTSAGLLEDRPRFNFAGSFYFAATVISTIGFGMTTPRTTAGRLATVAYGLFGCTGCILLFNLFLERVVTVCTKLLRILHNMKMQRLQRLQQQKNLQRQQTSMKVQTSLLVDEMVDDVSSIDAIEPWRPSVYKVLICLLLVTIMLICCSVFVYSMVERWSYHDAFYFAFIGFAAIGFGDFVPSQQPNDSPYIVWYRLANFAFLSVGVCLVYSLFNVFSLVVRQLLNSLIRKMDVTIDTDFLSLNPRKPRRYLGLGIRPPARWVDVDEGAENGLISLRQFLLTNQTNMFRLQKQLIDSAVRRSSTENLDDGNKISAVRVGPMGLLTDKFGQE